MTRSKLSQMNNLKKEVLLSTKSERVEMTLNTESALASGLLIQRLTELYEDPIEATVRETVSNGLDATTIAHSGNRPVVRVTAPTSLNPVLVISDNGVGMTYEDLKNIYSKYGASTKVNDLEQIGAYGLGAKAPLAYGTEFTVTSTKDGQKTTIIVAREEMTNYIKIVDSIETDEPSGTTVSIPVNNSDINRFNDNVNKYLESPIDKNVDLYVNGKLVKNDNYTLITDKALIADGEEKTYGRVWIEPSNAIQLITKVSVDDIKHSLKFLIGGWTYESPLLRNSRYYRGVGKGIIVELKAGIVGFNSSRDAILENERYEKLENLMIDYISSEQFVKDLTKGINNMELSDFKETVGALLNAHRKSAEIIDNKVVIKNVNVNNSYYSHIARNYKFEDFVHAETGFSINDLLSEIPKTTQPTIAFCDRKYSYHKTSRNHLMNNKLNGYRKFEETSITELNEVIDDIMNGKSESHSLEMLMLNLSMYGYCKNKDVVITFVTDIDDEENLRKLKAGRKSIVRMRNEDIQLNNEYRSIVVYTKHTKNDIENMIGNHFENLDLKIFKVDEILENLKELRKQNKTVVVKREEKLSTTLNRYDFDNNTIMTVDVENLDSDKHKIIVVSKHRYPEKSRLNMMYKWYCNENNVSKKDIELYISLGNHRVSDLELLMEVGEVFRDPTSEEAGKSKFYMENVHDKVIGLNAILNESINTKTKSFVRLLSGIYGRSPESIKQSLEMNFDRIYDMAKIANIELPAYPAESLNVLEKIHNEEFSDISSYEWSLEDSAISHLIKNIGSEYFDLTQNLLNLISSRRIVIKNENDFNVYHNRETSNFTVDLVEEVYNETTGTKSYNKMLKVQIESYIEFVKEIIEEMSIIK